MLSFELLVMLMAGILSLAAIAIFVYLRVPRKLKATYFGKRWQEIQSYCKDKNNWTQAIVEADQLLNSALKKRRLKGKSMGERMVSAQRIFSDNDGVWYAHNLCKKLISEEKKRLREAEVKDALLGFRQALRDIGALPNDK